MSAYLIFILGFLIRLISLNQSLWLDEAVTAKVAQSIPFHLIASSFSPADVHPPLYYMFISLWTNMIGSSEIALRMPSVIFSLIAGWYVYKMGGKWAAALFLFNPLIIYYAQEARMHMMATMLLTAALYHFMKIAAPPRADRNDMVLFNLFSALALFTFYGSGFFIGAMIIVGFFSFKKKGEFVYLLIGLFVSLLFLSPLLYQQLLNSKAGLEELTNWSGALGNVDFKNLALFPLKFATGRLSWMPKWSYYLIAGIPTVITWIVVAFGMRKNKVLAYLFILPLLFGMIISVWAPMMMYFRFLYLIPVMSILISEQIQKPIRNKIGFFILYSYCAFTFAYLLTSAFHREDWKSAAKALDSSIPLYMIIPSSDPIAYYRSDIPVYELRTLNKNSIPEIIQVIPYTSNLYGIEYAELLEKSGCVKEFQASFRGDVIVEWWKCLRNA